MRRLILALFLILIPAEIYAAQIGLTQARHVGVSGLWVLANFSYAGMRAQHHPSAGWRVLAFIFGLPGTLLTFLSSRREVNALMAWMFPGEGRERYN
jgi:hypothetical protein